MERILKKLQSYAPSKPSNWSAEAEQRQLDKGWLRYSQMIVIFVN